MGTFGDVGNCDILGKWECGDNMRTFGNIMGMWRYGDTWGHADIWGLRNVGIWNTGKREKYEDI